MYIVSIWGRTRSRDVLNLFTTKAANLKLDIKSIYLKCIVNIDSCLACKHVRTKMAKQNRPHTSLGKVGSLWQISEATICCCPLSSRQYERADDAVDPLHSLHVYGLLYFCGAIFIKLEPKQSEKRVAVSVNSAHMNLTRQSV